MLLCINRLFTFLLILHTFLSAQYSEAADSLNYSGGKWTSTSGASAYGKNTSQIYWGTPIDDDEGINGMSSYLYEAVTYPVEVPVGESFKIGQFTHFNRRVYGNSISGANLQVDLSFTIGGSAINDITFNTQFQHTETNNGSSGGNCCDDLVTLVLDETTSFEFTVDNIIYNLELLGFYFNDSIVTSFITPENSVGVADFLAILTTATIPEPPVQPPITPPIDPPEVINPEPETYLILGGALLFILLKRGKRKRKHQKTKLAFMDKESPTFFLGRFWKQ